MSTHGQFNTKSPTIKRILKEAAELASTPDPTLHASPLDTNLFEWHFTLLGPPSTPYSHGIYHGRIILPPSYPLRPPSFRFLTPSGRFETNREICLSISGHHEESWQPAWGVRTALLAIRSFMKEEAGGQVGGLEMGAAGRERLARESRGWTCGGCGGRTNEAVLGESERAAGAGKARAEEKVPEELRLGYRDELGKGRDGAKEEAGPEKAPDHVSPASTTTTTTVTPGLTPSSSQASLPAVPTASSSVLFSPPPARAPTAPVPTRTIQVRPPRASRRVSTAATAVPAWVDKAIVGVLVGLVVMVVRKWWVWL